jgi:hypothetical protein
MNASGIYRQVEGYVGTVLVKIGEIFLDHVAFVAKANYKLGNTVLRVRFHDVPQEGSATDFNEGFGANDRLLADSGTETARQYYSFHPKARDFPNSSTPSRR